MNHRKAYDVYRGGSDHFYVLLHALGFNRTYFAPLASRLKARECSYITLDLPGHGYARDFVAQTYPQVVQYVTSILDTEGIQDIILVGHSMGGFIAQALCLHEPNRIQQTVLINSAYELSLETLRLSFVLLGYEICAVINNLIWLGKHTSNPTVDFSMLRGRANLRCVYLSSLATSRTSMRIASKLMGSQSFLPDLHKIHTPVTIVRSSRDEIFRHKVAEVMNAQLPNSTIVDIAGSHSVHNNWATIETILTQSS